MLVSIISINYNSANHTHNMVKSILSIVPIDFEYEIIIVDNASEDADYTQLTRIGELPRVKIVSSRYNGGFATGNMLGIQHAHGRYYLFLNNDTLLQNDIITTFFDYAETNPNVGLLSGQLYDEYGNRSTSFKTFPSLSKQLLGSGLARLISANRFPGNKTLLNQPTEVGVVSGSCMFFRREVFDRIGGFDTTFFLYCEEEDISKRVWNHGASVVSLPEAKITHFAGASTEKSLAIAKEFYISYTLLLDKHFPAWQVCLMKLLQIFKLLRRSFRSKKNIFLLTFMLRGAPLRESLRYQQILKGNR